MKNIRMTRTNFMKCAIECSIFKIYTQYFALIYMQNGSTYQFQAHIFFTICKIYFSHHKFYSVLEVCVFVFVCMKKKRQSRILFILCPNLSKKIYSYLRTSALCQFFFLQFLYFNFFLQWWTQNHDYDNHEILTARKKMRRRRKKNHYHFMPRRIIIINKILNRK